MFDPASVNSPADLPADFPVVIETRGKLNLHARQPLSYTFHWLREVALGVIEGDLGLDIESGAEVSTQLVLNAAYRQEISLDEQGRLRLRVLKLQTGDFDLAAKVSASVRAATPLPPEPDALVAAILGVHKNQWATAAERIRTAVPDAVRQLLGLWNAARTSPAEALAAAGDLDGWVRNQIESLYGPIRTEADVSRLLEGLRALVGLKESVYRQAVSAAERKHEAQLSWRYHYGSRDTALLDCSFAFTAPGLACYRRALAGDYAWLLEADTAHVEVRQGTLTSGLASHTTVELHLPFFDRKAWMRRVESLARMEVASDGDGRVLVYAVEASHRIESRNSCQSVLALAGGMSVGRVHRKASFTLSYTDQRALPFEMLAHSLAPTLRAYDFDPGAGRRLEELAAGRTGKAEVSLALSIPGSLVEAWLDAPGERAPEFFAVYSRVSVAVQRALRVWLPYVYFSDPKRYETLEAAYPLLVYQASRPFSGRPRYDFNYDVLSEDSMRVFFRATGPLLAAELARVEETLMRAGKPGTAAFYAPRRARDILASVQNRRRQLNSLLVADAFLVDALVNLGCQGRRLREDAAKDPPAAVRGLARFAADLVKAFHGKLRRLYGGQQFLAFGALLLVEATHALSAGTAGPTGLQATVRVSQGAAEDPAGFSQTLVNAAYLAERAEAPS
ncbi:MAG: hypothetical protein IT159_13860 [Bryobacterales bacterium]|nr:hypothetical protein [Bryobacterales bacterium]